MKARSIRFSGAWLGRSPTLRLLYAVTAVSPQNWWVIGVPRCCHSVLLIRGSPSSLGKLSAGVLWCWNEIWRGKIEKQLHPVHRWRPTLWGSRVSHRTERPWERSLLLQRKRLRLPSSPTEGKREAAGQPLPRRAAAPFLKKRQALHGGSSTDTRSVDHGCPGRKKVVVQVAPLFRVQSSHRRHHRCHPGTTLSDLKGRAEEFIASWPFWLLVRRTNWRRFHPVDRHFDHARWQLRPSGRRYLGRCPARNHGRHALDHQLGRLSENVPVSAVQCDVQFT